MSKSKNIIPRSTYKLDRNRAIYKEYLAGTRCEVIAVKYGISYRRVYTIITNEKKLEEVKK